MEVMLVVVGVFFAGLGTLAFAEWWESERQQVKRALRASQRTTVANAEEGQPVKILGVLKYRRKPLRAPLTRRRCALWWVEIYEQRGKHWKKILDEAKFKRFF